MFFYSLADRQVSVHIIIKKVRQKFIGLNYNRLVKVYNLSWSCKHLQDIYVIIIRLVSKVQKTLVIVLVFSPNIQKSIHNSTNKRIISRYKVLLFWSNSLSITMTFINLIVGVLLPRSCILPGVVSYHEIMYFIVKTRA